MGSINGHRSIEYGSVSLGLSHTRVVDKMPEVAVVVSVGHKANMAGESSLTRCFGTYTCFKNTPMNGFWSFHC